MNHRKRFWWVVPFTIGVLLWAGWNMAFSSAPINEGAAAPDFELKDQAGNLHKLSNYRGKNVVLMFYPKSFTGGCTAQMCAVRDSYEELSKTGAVIFGISVDNEETQHKFAKEHNLKQTILADEGGEVAKEYGVLMGSGFASRVTFVVNPEGKIAKVFPKAATKEHPAELLSYFSAAANDEEKELAFGKKAPNFTLPLTYGGMAPKEVQLYDMPDKGNKKAYVLMFIATRCPVSLAYDERMSKLAKEYTSKGIQFIGINSNSIEPADEVANHAKDKGFTFPVLKDEGNKVADTYKAAVTPEIYVLDAEFNLKYHGRIDDSQNPANVKSHDLKVALDAVLAGKEVPNERTKAVGCTIKRVK